MFRLNSFSANINITRFTFSKILFLFLIHLTSVFLLMPYFSATCLQDFLDYKSFQASYSLFTGENNLLRLAEDDRLITRNKMTEWAQSVTTRYISNHKVYLAYLTSSSAQLESIDCCETTFWYKLLHQSVHQPAC